MIEHIVLFNDVESFLIPIVTMIDRPFVRAEFEVGAKYRIYFYVVPGNLADIDNTRVELLGPRRQSVNFVLTKHSRKRFVSANLKCRLDPETMEPTIISSI